MRRGTQVGKGGLNLTHSRVRTLLKFIAPCKAKLFLIFLLSLNAKWRRKAAFEAATGE